MEIRQLHYFLSAAKHLNFTKAAKECFIVQTSMTHQIAALEKELGVTLFQRTNRSVCLTPAGLAFLKEARRIVASSERAVAQTRAAAQGAESVFRIGQTGRILCNDLPRILRAFSDANPRVRLDLRRGSTDEMLELLDSGELDCLFSLEYDFFHQIPWLERTVLFTDRIMVSTPREYEIARKERVTPEEIRVLPYILYREKGALEKIGQYAVCGSPLNVYATLDDPLCAETMVEAGFGITLCFSSLCAWKDDRVAFVRLDGPGSRTNILLVNRKDADHPYLPDFRRMLLSFDYQYLKD